MARLKVYKGNFDGLNFRMVACTSKIRAMELFGKSKRDFERNFSETNLKKDIEVAISNPEVVFWKTISPSLGVNARWIEVRMIY